MTAFSVCLVCTVVMALAAGKKSVKQWQKTNWDGIERELERGDDPALLESEDQVKIADMERRRATPLERPISAEMTGAAWTAEALDIMTAEWKELLKTAGIESTPYDMKDNKVLMTLQDGWRGYELQSFLLRQDAVIEVEWDQVKYPKHRSENSAEPAKVPAHKKAAKKPRKEEEVPDMAGEAADIQFPGSQAGKVTSGKGSTPKPRGKSAISRKIEELVKGRGGKIKVASGHEEKPQPKTEL